MKKMIVIIVLASVVNASSGEISTNCIFCKREWKSEYQEQIIKDEDGVIIGGIDCAKSPADICMFGVVQPNGFCLRFHNPTTAPLEDPKPSPKNCVDQKFKEGFAEGVKWGILSYMQNPGKDDINFHVTEAQKWYWMIVVDKGKAMLDAIRHSPHNSTSQGENK